MSRRTDASSGPTRSAPRILRALAVAAALGSLAFEGGFRGCGGESSPPGAPLPEGEPPECLVDSDCSAPMCSDALCVAGRCRVVEARIDNDGDRVVAEPCGTDCDDSNAFVFPGAGESCDAIDNDCDENVDEGASPTPIQYELGATVRAAESVTTLPGVILVSVDPAPTGFDLVARWFDLGPTAPLAIERIAAVGEEGVIVASLPRAEGAQLFWYVPAERALRELSVGITRTDDSAELTLTPPTDVLTDVALTGVRAVSTPSGHALLLEELDETMGTRSRSLLVAGSARVPLPYGDSGGAFDLASRDTRFYTPAGDAEIAVLDAAGTEVNRVVLPGSSALDAVASWNGRILAPVSDLSDYTLREITAADTLGDGWPLSTGFGPDIRLHPLAASLAVTRVTGGVDLAIYDARLDLTESYVGLAYSSSGLYSYRTVLETSAGLTAVVARGPGEGSAIVLMQCRP